MTSYTFYNEKKTGTGPTPFQAVVNTLGIKKAESLWSKAYKRQENDALYFFKPNTTEKIIIGKITVKE